MQRKLWERELVKKYQLDMFAYVQSRAKCLVHELHEDAASSTDSEEIACILLDMIDK